MQPLPGRFFNLFRPRFGNLSNSGGRKTAVAVLPQPTGNSAAASLRSTGAFTYWV
jgi:hypothetical protein